MLRERPVLFVPRLVSTGLSTSLIVAWFSGWLGSFLFIAFFPLLAVLGAFTPVMVSSMVEKEDRENLLRHGLYESLSLWPQIAGLTLLTAFLAFLNSLPLTLGMLATYVTGNIVYAATGIALSLVFLLGVSFGLYFVPISLVADGDFFKSLRSSFNASNNNRKEVVALTLFSLAVLVASSYVTGWLKDIGLLVFSVGRMVSAVVGTYLLVISPQYYLENEGET
jgi:hypothetical protein